MGSARPSGPGSFSYNKYIDALHAVIDARTRKVVELRRLDEEEVKLREKSSVQASSPIAMMYLTAKCFALSSCEIPCNFIYRLVGKEDYL